MDGAAEHQRAKLGETGQGRHVGQRRAFQVQAADIAPQAGQIARGHDALDVQPRYLNTHIGYGVTPSPPGVADDSLALPMGLAVSSDGAELYVAAYGSNKVAILDTAALEPI